MKGGEQLRALADFLMSLVECYLPRFYRDRWIGSVTPDLRRATLITGIVQMLVCVLLFVFGYLRWIAYLGALFARAAASSTVEISERNYAIGVGMTSLLSYMFRPTTVLIVFFLLEGLARFSAALITGETISTLPLFAASLLQRRLEFRRREKLWGMRVADRVDPCSTGCDLRIHSCRPKDWGSLVTLSYEGELYVLDGEEEAPAPRRFVYRLKKLPPGTVVRGLRQYDPEEPLKQAPS